MVTLPTYSGKGADERTTNPCLIRAKLTRTAGDSHRRLIRPLDSTTQPHQQTLPTDENRPSNYNHNPNIEIQTKIQNANQNRKSEIENPKRTRKHPSTSMHPAHKFVYLISTPHQVILQRRPATAPRYPAPTPPLTAVHIWQHSFFTRKWQRGPQSTTRRTASSSVGDHPTAVLIQFLRPFATGPYHPNSQAVHPVWPASTLIEIRSSESVRPSV